MIILSRQRISTSRPGILLLHTTPLNCITWSGKIDLHQSYKKASLPQQYGPPAATVRQARRTWVAAGKS